MWEFVKTYIPNTSLARLGLGMFILSVVVTTPLIVLAADNAPSCSGPAYMWNFDFCFFNGAFAIIGSFLVSIGALLLYLAGSFLEGTIAYGIVGFGDLYAGTLKIGIEQVWTILRDFANIGIIGAFVFVAISTILSIDTYHVKNFIARLLIAAVLINFSLFFTKAAFDVSNLTAAVFANAISTTSTSENATVEVSASSGGQVTGFSGAYLQALGISGVFDVSVLKNVGRQTGTSWMALLTGILMFVFLAAAAIVFIYAGALIIVRTVTAIFLLMVSAAAFAARAIPKMDSYWNDWQSRLMKSALFAPLLMMFLWAILIVTKALAPTGGQNLSVIVQSIGEQGQGSISLNVLFNFAVIIGLMITAIKTADKASSWAGPKILSSKAMIPGNYAWAGLKGLPNGMWNAWNYQASKSAQQRLDQGATAPNMAQRAWASTRGLFGGDTKKILTQMENIKKARLGREAAGKVGLQYREIPGIGKSLSGLKSDAEFAKKVLTEGVPKGGYAEIAKKAAAEELAKTRTDLGKETKVSTEEKVDINQNAIKVQLDDAHKAAPEKQTPESDKAIKELASAVEKLTKTKETFDKTTASNTERQRHASDVAEQRREVAKRIEDAKNELVRSKVNTAEKLPDLEKAAREQGKNMEGGIFNKKLDDAITKRTDDPVKEMELRGLVNAQKENARWKDILSTAMKDTGANESATPEAAKTSPAPSSTPKK